MSASSAWPVVVDLTRTPSTRTWTWLAFAPRIVIDDVLPRLPERRTSTPGTRRSASSTVAYW